MTTSSTHSDYIGQPHQQPGRPHHQRLLFNNGDSLIGFGFWMKSLVTVWSSCDYVVTTSQWGVAAPTRPPPVMRILRANPGHFFCGRTTCLLAFEIKRSQCHCVFLIWSSCVAGFIDQEDTVTASRTHSDYISDYIVTTSKTPTRSTNHRCWTMTAVDVVVLIVDVVVRCSHCLCLM